MMTRPPGVMVILPGRVSDNVAYVVSSAEFAELANVAVMLALAKTSAGLGLNLEVEIGVGCRIGYQDRQADGNSRL